MSLPENPYQAPDATGRSIPEADALPKLGSLAQSARGNELGKARKILFWIGGLTLAFNTFMFINAPNEIEQAIQKEIQAGGPGFVVDQALLAQTKASAVLLVRALYGGLMALGLLYIVFGFILRKFPVPITIASLLLYILANAGLALVDPMTLLNAVIFKIIVVAALFKAIQAAFAYKKEEALAAGLPS